MVSVSWEDLFASTYSFIERANVFGMESLRGATLGLIAPVALEGTGKTDGATKAPERSGGGSRNKRPAPKASVQRTFEKVKNNQAHEVDSVPCTLSTLTRRFAFRSNERKAHRKGPAFTHMCVCTAL